MGETDEFRLSSFCFILFPFYILYLYLTSSCLKAVAQIREKKWASQNS